MTERLFIRPGMDAPGPLPSKAFDEHGSVWTDLQNNPEAVAACGFEEVEPQPTFDPSSESISWVNGAWNVTSTAPTKVSALQFELELEARGLLATVKAMVATASETDPTVDIYWRRTDEFHIEHPVLLAMVAAGASHGFNEALLKDVFTSARGRS